MKQILLSLFILSSLLSCGDSSQDKATKNICKDFEKKINIDKEKCFKDKKYFKELRFQHDVVLEIERIKKFNNEVEKFNLIDLKTNDQDFLLVDIENFTKKNEINTEGSLFKLRNDLDRKKLKFKSYFEIKRQENSEEYFINFYNSDQYLYSSLQKKETFKIPNLSSAKFQNIEVKRKIETIIKSIGSERFGFGIPLNKANSTIYGYFINREINRYDTNDLLSLYKNKKIKLNDIKEQVFYINEFYITDIKLEKISFKKKEVEDYVRDNKLLVAISNINK